MNDTPELVFVKLGGSLITDKTRQETPRLEVLSRLAQEIAEGLKSRPGLQLILGHGSGSYGHFAGRLYETRQGIIAGQEDRGWRGYARTCAAAARLNRIVVDALQSVDLPAVSFPPSASAACRDGLMEYMDWHVIRRALAAGLLPVVYGDVALDDTQGCTIVSTEQVFSYLSGRLDPRRILIAGTVDGVFTSDPLANKTARRIPLLRAGQLGSIESSLGGSHGVDVTGGMASKVREMADLVARRPALQVQILSGEFPGALRDALADSPTPRGTLITA